MKWMKKKEWTVRGGGGRGNRGGMQRDGKEMR